MPGDLRFEALDIEIKRGGVSYAVDTVAQLRELYTAAEFFFIIGVAIAIARWLVIRKEEKAAAELADATRGGPPGNLGGTKPK